jgi:hypothetical protein
VIYYDIICNASAVYILGVALGISVGLSYGGAEGSIKKLSSLSFDKVSLPVACLGTPMLTNRLSEP